MDNIVILYARVSDENAEMLESLRRAHKELKNVGGTMDY